MRALTSGQLHGVRANTGRWRISSDELERWISDRPASEPVKTDQKPDKPDLADMNQVESLRKERDEARIEAATLRVELNQFILISACWPSKWSGRWPSFARTATAGILSLLPPSRLGWPGYGTPSVGP